MIPTNFQIRLSDRQDRHGNPCAAVYILPPGNQREKRMTWLHVKRGSCMPEGSHLATLKEEIRKGKPAAIFCHSWRDGVRCYAHLMEQREAQLATEAGSAA
jgi:hypothetical protein